MLARFWNLFRRRRLDLKLDAELTHHLEFARSRASRSRAFPERCPDGGTAGLRWTGPDERRIP